MNWIKRQRIRLGWWLVGRPPEAAMLLTWAPAEIKVIPLAVGIGQADIQMRWFELPSGVEEGHAVFVGGQGVIT